MTAVFGGTAAAFAALILAFTLTRHHPRWHRAGAYEPAHAPGSERSPRAAAGSDPGSESRRSFRGACAGKTGGGDGLFGDTGVLPAGRGHLPTDAERTAMFAQLAPQCPRCGGPHYEDECDATERWPGQPGQNGGQRAGLAVRDSVELPPVASNYLPAPAAIGDREETITLYRPPVVNPFADTQVLGADKGMGMAGRLGSVQPWDTAPQPRCEALVPLPPDDRYMDPRPCPDAVPDPVVRGEAEISADETAEWAERWREAFSPADHYHPPGSCDACADPPDFSLYKEPGPGPDDTVTDMRPVPATVAARERAITTMRNREHVQRTLTWQSGTRTWVLDVIGPDPAQDWEQLLAQARAGGSDE